MALTHPTRSTYDCPLCTFRMVDDTDDLDTFEELVYAHQDEHDAWDAPRDTAESKPQRAHPFRVPMLFLALCLIVLVLLSVTGCGTAQPTASKVPPSDAQVWQDAAEAAPACDDLYGGPAQVVRDLTLCTDDGQNVLMAVGIIDCGAGELFWNERGWGQVPGGTWQRHADPANPTPPAEASAGC